MWMPMERNNDQEKVKSRTISRIQAPRWKIWVTNLLSLTVFLLISFKSLDSYLFSSVLTPPEFMLDFWKCFFLLSPDLGVIQPAPSVVSSECYWSSAMLKNEMEIMFIPSTLRQPVKKFRYVMIIPLWFKNSDKPSLLFVKDYKFQLIIQSFPKFFQSYQILNFLLFYLLYAGVLGDAFLELLINGRRTMEKRKKKLGLRGVLLLEQPKRYLNSLNNDYARTMDKFTSSIYLPNLKPPTHKIKTKKGRGSNPRFEQCLLDMIKCLLGCALHKTQRLCKMRFTLKLCNHLYNLPP